MTDQDISEVETIFNKFSEPFHQLKTEKQRLAQFKYYDSYIPPQNYQIGKRIEYKSAPTGTKRKDIPVVAQFIPIRQVLKKFFELPGIFDKTIKYLNILDSQKTIITNIYQSSHWKQKISSCKDKIVLPLVMFFDDYENNNALGSNKGIAKCGAVYLSIPCLPPEYQSKLQNIFLFILFNTLDRSQFSNKIIFTKVVEEFTFLREESILINFENGEKEYTLT